MDVVYERCAGLDIHKKLLVAGVLVSEAAEVPRKQIRSFGTMTGDLLVLRAWLAEQGVQQIAMEATGIYWRPLYNVLEDASWRLLLVNARHIKAVLGKKTDVRDCEWIAELLRHGLLRASFVPDRAQREVRELTRYRTSLVGERSAEVNRLQKTLEGANIKLAAVASSIWASRDVRCWRRWSPAPPTRQPSRTWPGGAYVTSCRNWSGHCVGSSETTSVSW